MVVRFIFLLLVTASASATILRGDDRIEVKETREFEVADGVHGARKVGLIRAWDRARPENITMCTGTLVGPDLLLTAAHCVINIRSGKPFNYLDFVPRATSEGQRYEAIPINKGWVLKAYLKENKQLAFNQAVELESISSSMVLNDIALLEVVRRDVNKGAGISYGTYGTWRQEYDLDESNDDIFDMYLLSYPGDKPIGSLWYEECFLQHTYSNQAITTCDTYQGASGSAILQYSDTYDAYHVTGVISAQTSSRNLVTLFTKEIRHDLLTLKKKHDRPLKLFSEVQFD